MAVNNFWRLVTISDPIHKPKFNDFVSDLPTRFGLSNDALIFKIDNDIDDDDLYLLSPECADIQIPHYASVASAPEDLSIFKDSFILMSGTEVPYRAFIDSL